MKERGLRLREFINNLTPEERQDVLETGPKKFFNALRESQLFFARIGQNWLKRHSKKVIEAGKADQPTGQETVGEIEKIRRNPKLLATSDLDDEQKDNKETPPAASKTESQPKKKRQFSPEVRRRMSEAQKKRWAKWHRDQKKSGKR